MTHTLEALNITVVANKSGDKYAYPRPDGGPSEQRLHRETRGHSVPLGDLLHALHEDTGCWNCADNHKCHQASVEENQRLLNAYTEMQKGLLLLLRPYQEPDSFNAPVDTLDELIVKLQRLSERGGRIFRGGA